MSKNYDEIIGRMMKEIQFLKDEQRRFSAQTKLFQILNVNAPAQLTADQNNYDPGDFDLLLLTSDASRTITGISGGVSGRVLYLTNNGSAANIVLAHQSASSSASNRLALPGGVSHTMTPNPTGTRTRCVLIYTEERWRLHFESAP